MGQCKNNRHALLYFAEYNNKQFFKLFISQQIKDSLCSVGSIFLKLFVQIPQKKHCVYTPLQVRYKSVTCPSALRVSFGFPSQLIQVLPGYAEGYTYICKGL